jgi:hypothetical protein
MSASQAVSLSRPPRNSLASIAPPVRRDYTMISDDPSTLTSGPPAGRTTGGPGWPRERGRQQAPGSWAARARLRKQSHTPESNRHLTRRRPAGVAGQPYTRGSSGPAGPAVGPARRALAY